MKISAIQPNNFNKVSFKQEENKSQPENNVSENEGMSKNQKITAGVVTAAVALAGLGYLGYKGHLGKAIQKLLGGAEDAAKNLSKDSDITTEPHKFLSAEEAKNLSYSEQTTRVMADIEAIEKESTSLDDAFDKIDKYIDGIAKTDSIPDKNIDLMEAVGEKLISKYSEAISKQNGNSFIAEIKSTLAQINLVKQKYSSAEKLALDLINDKDASINSNKIDAFEILLEASEALGKKAKAEEIFDNEVQQALNELNLLRAQNKSDDKVWRYLYDIKEKLTNVYGENNPTIKAIAQAIN
ncbi:hypothetical protein DBY21_10105 [Candidatus Gastranaerophilales bacterium]|nr:MAG: hypothetical protein DBY21_10105 [Candidatus Gastranaerophilales bacterium]